MMIGQRVQRYRTTTSRYVKRYPLFILALMLVGLLVLIIFSSQLQEVESPDEAIPPIRSVRTFTLGAQPKIEVVAQVEQTGEVTIVAQNPGIVQAVPVQPGDKVSARQRVASLSTNYYGGNVQALQSMLARTQYQHARDTLQTQLETVQLQRELADTNLENTEEMRSITQRSIGETRELIDLNQLLLDNLDLVLQESTVSAEIQAAQQAQSQLLGATNQLRQALRANEYQADSDAPPAELAELQRELTMRQLDLQEKSLELNVAVAKFQSKIAAVSAAQMYPAAPFSGVVQRVHVKQGESVSPGTPLVTIYCDQLVARLRASLSPEIAAQLTPYAQSTVYLPNGQHFYTQPIFVSQVPTSGGFVTAEFVVPEEIGSQLSAVRQVQMSLPVQAPVHLDSQLFVPIDAVHQTEQISEVFVIDEGVARARQVQLGHVVGGYVLITEGLHLADEVILDRAVVTGQSVQRIEISESAVDSAI